MPVKTEKARIFILRNQNKDQEIQRCITSDDKLEFYDNFLMDCKEALQAVKEDLNYEMVREQCTTGRHKKYIDLVGSSLPISV